MLFVGQPYSQVARVCVSVPARLELTKESRDRGEELRAFQIRLQAYGGCLLYAELGIVLVEVGVLPEGRPEFVMPSPAVLKVPLQANLLTVEMYYTYCTSE